MHRVDVDDRDTDEDPDMINLYDYVECEYG